MASPTTAFNVARRATAGRSWTPFRSGAEYSDAAAVAKLTGAIMTGARLRGVRAQAQEQLARENRYRDLQTQILEKRLAEPAEQKYEMDVAMPGALSPGEVGPQVQTPSMRVGGLSGAHVVAEADRAASADALARERAADNDRAERSLALRERAANSLIAARGKRAGREPDAGPKARRYLSEIERKETEFLTEQEERVRNDIDIALAELRRPGSPYQKWASGFTGLTANRYGGFQTQDPNSGATLTLDDKDVKNVVESIVRRTLTRRKLYASKKFGPEKEKYREIIEREAQEAGGNSAIDSFLEAFSSGP